MGSVLAAAAQTTHLGPIVASLAFAVLVTIVGHLTRTRFVIVTGLVILGVLVSSAPVAYGFAKIPWPGRDVVFLLVLATMMVPYQVMMVPLYLVFSTLGWVGGFKPLTVPAFFGDAFSIFLLRQFFLGIPHELSEAARIDGAS